MNTIPYILCKREGFYEDVCSYPVRSIRTSTDRSNKKPELVLDQHSYTHTLVIIIRGIIGTGSTSLLLVLQTYWHNFIPFSVF